MELTEKIARFNKERNWGQFHTPKNLAIGLSLEASELLEIFIWLTDEETKKLSSKQIGRVKDEVGDVTIYLLNLCEKLDIDLIKCASEKLKQNEIKYPVERAFGSAKKYNDL